jgi:hypothetical protein
MKVEMDITTADVDLAKIVFVLRQVGLRAACQAGQSSERSRTDRNAGREGAFSPYGHSGNDKTLSNVPDPTTRTSTDDMKYE